MAPGIHIHRHCTSYFHGFAFILGLSSPRYLVLIAYSSCSSKLPLPLHMTWSIEFTAHISVMLLGTSYLAFSCSSHRAVLFGRILSCTRRWFDRYSSLTSIFRVTFKDILERVWVLGAALEAP